MGKCCSFEISLSKLKTSSITQTSPNVGNIWEIDCSEYEDTSVQKEMPHLDRYNQQENFEANSRIVKLENENEELHQQLKHFKEWKTDFLTKKIFFFQAKSLKFYTKQYWDIWNSEPDTSLGEMMYFDLNTSENIIDIEEFTMAQKYLGFQSSTLVKENQLNTLLGSDSRPLSKHKIYSLMHDLLDKKSEMDKNDFEQKRQFRPITEFAVEHLTRVYGLKKLAYEKLSCLVLGLCELYNEGDEYGIFLCKLLQITHPEPISLALSVYLLLARHEFYKIARESNKKVFLSDAINMISSAFENDRSSRGVAIRMLKPEALTDEEYLMFRISHKIVKMGFTPEILYRNLDNNDAGELTGKNIIEGIRRTLEISLSKTDVSILEGFFSGHMQKEGFVSRISMNGFYVKSRSRLYSVNLVGFLSALIEAYKYMQIRDLATLNSWFKRNSKGTEDNEVRRLLILLDPLLDDDELDEFTKEIVGNGANFCQFVLKYHIGGYGLRDFRMDCFKERVLIRKGSEIPDYYETNRISRSETFSP